MGISQKLDAILVKCGYPNAPLTVDHSLRNNGTLIGAAYLVSLLCFTIGSILPLVLLFGGLYCLVAVHPSAAAFVISALVDYDGLLTAQATVAISVICFLTGFGAQVAYLMRATGNTNFNLLANYVKLKFSSVAGENTQSKLKNLALQVSVAMAAWLAIVSLVGLFIKPGEQPTATLFLQTSGWSAAAMFLLGAVLAPIFEEIVFRGFLYQELRSKFRTGQEQSLAANNRADILAMCVSSAIFSLSHLQFELGILIMLFLTGCFLCEIYRRSGSLWAGILFHALNNLIAFIGLISIQ